MQPGFTAGWLADEIQVNCEILKKIAVAETFEFLLCLTKVQHYYSLTNAFQWVFSDTTYWRVDF